jgi:spore coat protein JC
MWIYDKKLQYPVKIKHSNPAMARIIMTQLGGPDGETGASLRYLHQRYACPYNEITGLLTDVGISVSLLRISLLAVVELL